MPELQGQDQTHRAERPLDVLLPELPEISQAAPGSRDRSTCADLPLFHSFFACLASDRLRRRLSRSPDPVHRAAGGRQRHRQRRAHSCRRDSSQELGQPVIVDDRPGRRAHARARPGREVAARRLHARHGADRRARHHAPHGRRSCPTTSSAISSRSRWSRAGICCLRSRRKLPVKSITELIAYAKANPGKLTNASSSNGSPGHVGGELFKFMTGTQIVHVPYRGGALAIQDLIAGRVDMMFESLQSITPFAQAGKVHRARRQRRRRARRPFPICRPSAKPCPAIWRRPGPA